MNVSRCARLRWAAFALPNLVWMIGILCGVMLVGGCRLCADCDEDAYPSYGGSWQRTKRDTGRVGSIFDPGGSRASDLSARAQSDSANVTNRAGLGAGNENANSDQDSADANPNDERNPMETDGLEPPTRQREDELRDLEQRYEDLQLEEINHKRPRINAADWQ